MAQPVPRAARSPALPLPGTEREATIAAPRYVFWFWVAYLMLEYVRPPLLQQLHLQLLLLLVLPLIWLRDRLQRPWSPLLTMQLAFLAVCTAGIVVGENWFAAYFTTRRMYGNIAIAIVTSWVLVGRQSLRRGIWAWLLVSTYVAVWGITHDGRGTGGFLGDENDLALACVTALPFCFFGFERLSGWRRWLSGGLGLAFIAAIVESFSRGGFVGMAAVGSYCLFASRHRLRNALVVMATVIFFVALAPPAYIEDLKTIPDTEESTARVRLFLWTTAFNMWKDHPLLGVGGGSFYYQAGNYQPTGPEWHEARFQERTWAQAVHSLYFETLAEHGLVGVLLLASLMWLHFRVLGRLRRDVETSHAAPSDLHRDLEVYGPALAAAMVGYLTAGAFLSVLYYPYAWFFSGITVALEVTVRRELTTPVSSAHRPSGPRQT